MSDFVEVSFKGNRQEYYTYDGLDLWPGDWVIVQADRGEDLGQVEAVGSVAERKCMGPGGYGERPGRRVIRKARSDDVDRIRSLREDEHRVRAKTRKLVERHGLKMKVTEAEWQWDRNKLTIYFTADRRVDFRALVRDLARAFRTRIELKQIGVRDEAALLGGVGRCHRELCCSSWLPEIQSVSLQLAKDQNLSLNPAQISGVCGRLMSCLMYEHELYVQARRRFPREGKTLRTSRGRETVVSVDIFRDRVLLKDREGDRRTVELADLKEEVAEAGPPPGGNGDGGGSNDDAGAERE